MNEYIEKKKVLDIIESLCVPGKMYGTENCTLIDPYDAEEEIVSAPNADVELVKHGKWIVNTDDFVPKYRCSICGYNKLIAAGEGIRQEPAYYCNNCGAKMDIV